jgi:hypothetical protein
LFCLTFDFFNASQNLLFFNFQRVTKKQQRTMSSNAEQLADDYAQGEIDGVPKCGQGNRTKTEQVY